MQELPANILFKDTVFQLVTISTIEYFPQTIYSAEICYRYLRILDPLALKQTRNHQIQTANCY